MNSEGRAVFCFTHDLRVADNAALCRALSQEDSLACVYCFDPRWLQPNRYQLSPLGQHRYQFLYACLSELDWHLRQYGHSLSVYMMSPIEMYWRLYCDSDVRRVYGSINAGVDEQRDWQWLRGLDGMTVTQVHTHTLFSAQQLPFSVEGVSDELVASHQASSLANLPKTFSAFRRRVDDAGIPIHAPLGEPEDWPLTNIASSWPLDARGVDSLPIPETEGEPLFHGGSAAGLAHIHHYFSGDWASCYKETRNALDEPLHSTRFSPWLAAGAVSPHRIWHLLKHYENTHGANESTEWIAVELLWREYFQWYAHKQGVRMFAPRGLTGRLPGSFYPERFQRWCHGNTPYPIVNACMHQLQTTGYLSNRGRQIVASCCIHELGLDWRYGAAWFEQQLVDYDVASNWGNWQYIAGVGANPRGAHHFDLQKQADLYDPRGIYTAAWNGHMGVDQLDAVDAADWPVMPER
ncbi:Cryptochrome DASH [BD1-7 clade bacterium]|uniref:Cryptochrome DASH n=1 Tax=BD1-7 clade bacterium TaxID=2029982 RepID=A0A5S9PAH0_9GAMM|nr:Cryptochrome DASH [BD1-7 clade bacterium]